MLDRRTPDHGELRGGVVQLESVQAYLGVGAVALVAVLIRHGVAMVRFIILLRDDRGMLLLGKI